MSEILTLSTVKDFLDDMVIKYNNPDFIASDPIQVPHAFYHKEDIEISGFLTATIAWGNRKMIIRNAKSMMNLMGNTPYDFIMSYNESQINVLNNFVHRTFNGIDFMYFIKSLRNIYSQYSSLEIVFSRNCTNDSVLPAISCFKKVFFSLEHLNRTRKHVSDPSLGSAAKRINMMLRWFCRQDNKGVDFGIWKSISPSILSCPLDVHSGNVARKLGLISRKQNNVKALNELDANLRTLDAIDPVKYDFALFGLGVFEGF